MHHDLDLTKRGEAYALLHRAKSPQMPSLRPRGCPEGIDPKRWREAVQARVEEHLAATEALLAALDGADGDPDLEETGDREPLLGWPNGGQRITEDMAEDGDRELDESDREDDGTGEPSLGAPEIPPDYLIRGGSHGWLLLQGSQESWAKGANSANRNDCEDQNEDGGELIIGGGSGRL